MNAPKSLWMGDVDISMDEAAVKSILSSLNTKVKNIRLIRNKITGMKQGYCFIDFDTHQEAKFFMEMYNGAPIPNSKKLFRLNWATYNTVKYPKFEGNSVPEPVQSSQATENFTSSNFRGFRDFESPENNKSAVNSTYHGPEYTVYVGDLDYNVTDQILYGYFTSFYPSIQSAKVIYDLNSQKSKGFGFVKFSNPVDFERSIKEMDGQKILNKRIKVNQAQTSSKKNVNSSGSSGFPAFSFSCPINFEKNDNLFYKYNYPAGVPPQDPSRPIKNFSKSENFFFSNLINVSNFENYYTENSNMYSNTTNTFNIYNDNKTEDFFNKFPDEINSKLINKDICNNLLIKASKDPYSSFVPFAPPKRSNGLTQFLYYYNIIQVQYSVDKELKCYTENSKYGYTDSDSPVSDNHNTSNTSQTSIQELN